MAITLIGFYSAELDASATSITAASFTKVGGGAMAVSDFAAGDVILGLSARASGGVASVPGLPTGFTSLDTVSEGNNANLWANLRLYYKFVTTPSSDTSFSINGTGNSASGQAVLLYVLRGIDTTTPIDANGGTTLGGATTAGAPPSLTPVTAGAVVVSAIAGADSTALSAYTAPADADAGTFLTQTGTTTPANRVQGALSLHSGWTSGAYSPATFGGGTVNSTGWWCTASVALRPKASTADNATSSGSIALTGSATAKVRDQATASASLALTGTATARLNAQGASSGSLPLSGTANASVALHGASGGDLALFGAAAASSSVETAAAGDLALSGSASGVHVAQFPAVVTPPSRVVVGSLTSRTAAGNLQPRRATA